MTPAIDFRISNPGVIANSSEVRVHTDECGFSSLPFKTPSVTGLFGTMSRS